MGARQQPLTQAQRPHEWPRAAPAHASPRKYRREVQRCTPELQRARRKSDAALLQTLQRRCWGAAVGMHRGARFHAPRELPALQLHGRLRGRWCRQWRKDGSERTPGTGSRGQGRGLRTPAREPEPLRSTPVAALQVPSPYRTLLLETTRRALRARTRKWASQPLGGPFQCAMTRHQLVVEDVWEASRAAETHVSARCGVHKCLRQIGWNGTMLRSPISPGSYACVRRPTRGA